MIGATYIRTVLWVTAISLMFRWAPLYAMDNYASPRIAKSFVNNELQAEADIIKVSLSGQNETVNVKVYLRGSPCSDCPETTAYLLEVTQPSGTQVWGVLEGKVGYRNSQEGSVQSLPLISERVFDRGDVNAEVRDRLVTLSLPAGSLSFDEPLSYSVSSVRAKLEGRVINLAEVLDSNFSDFQSKVGLSPIHLFNRMCLDQ